MNIGSTLARLFTDRPSLETQRQSTQRQEPRLTGAKSSQDNTPTVDPTLKALPPPVSMPVQNPEARYDLRNVSPREFADITHELYMDGTLSWPEFQMVGFPSELDREAQRLGTLNTSALILPGRLYVLG
ncbi:MAG: hypothetical protein HY055_09990 [Magnetospirillum sp.]|nr:hypothetical protein [Magnetospirillum sp.]